MMTGRFYKPLLAVLICLACNKRKPDSEKQISERTKLITTGQWKLSENLINGVSNFQNLPSCLTDNYLVFKADGTVEYNEGPTKCNVSASQVLMDVWKFDDNENSLWLSGGKFTILALTATTLKFYTANITGETSEKTFSH